MTVGQTQFVEALLTPDRDVPMGLSDPQGRRAGKRFDIYRNNVAVSLTEALETAFPVIAKLLGERTFKQLSGIFLRAHPPSSPLMMFYGEALPAFLEGFEPLAHLGYLPDVARLELALRQSYHAADEDAADASVLQSLPAERLMATAFTLAPAVKVLRSPWPIHALWQYNMTEGAPKPQMKAEAVLITRPEYDPDLTLLGKGDAAFVLALQKGSSLGAAFEAAQAADPEFDLTQALGHLLGGQAITALDTPA